MTEIRHETAQANFSIIYHPLISYFIKTAKLWEVPPSKISVDELNEKWTAKIFWQFPGNVAAKTKKDSTEN